MYGVKSQFHYRVTVRKGRFSFILDIFYLKFYLVSAWSCVSLCAKKLALGLCNIFFYETRHKRTFEFGFCLQYAFLFLKVLVSMFYFNFFFIDEEKRKYFSQVGC